MGRPSSADPRAGDVGRGAPIAEDGNRWHVFGDPDEPEHAYIVWANADDDDADGMPDSSQITQSTEVIDLDSENEFHEVRWQGGVCGDVSCLRWTINHPATHRVRIWYRQEGEEDTLPDKALIPWSPEGVKHLRIGGSLYHQFPCGQTMQGDPREDLPRFYVEALDPGDWQVEMRISPGGNADWTRRGVLRLAAIGMDAFDLRGWGQSLTYYGDPALVHTDTSLDPPPVPSEHGWRVGGAITDGASICLLRLRRGDAPGWEALDETWLETTKPGGGGTLSMRAGGSLFSRGSDAWPLPLLPVAESGEGPGSTWPSRAMMTRGQALYVPPESYLDPAHNPGLGADALNSEESCVIAFRAKAPDAEDPSVLHDIPGSRSFILRRPPVVLVHGIMSSPATWGATAYSEAAGTPVPTRLYKADYSATATKGYSENFHVVPETIASALSDYRNAIDGNHHPLRRFNGIRYAATRADVIGHSQGGQLARTYISNLDWADLGAINRTRNGVQTVWPVATFFRTGTFGDRRYLRPDNWGAGDIRRLVTIGSPFKGSPIANALEPWLEPTVENIGFHQTMYQLSPSSTFWQLLYEGGDPFTGAPNAPTCVADLCVGSRVQSLLESPTAYPTGHKQAPWAPMVGIATQSVGDAPVQGALWELLFTFTPGLPNNPFAIEPLSPANSDLIVEQWSQRNADHPSDNPNAALPWVFQFHTHIIVPIQGIQAETESPIIGQQIGELLSQPRSFFLNGVLH